MASTILYQSSLEERIVFYALSSTYPIYFVGGLYVLGSLLGWILLMLFLFRCYLKGSGLKGSKISPLVWFWVFAMLMMLVALIAAHEDRMLGAGTTIKSSIGWAKGWALLALFPLIGCLINIRVELIVRACCIAAASAMPFAFIGLAAYLVGLPGDIYLSPLKAVGGPGEVFLVRLYGLNPETGMARWQFTGPWAPAAGLLSCFYLVIVFNEKDTKWRFLGVLGALTMCVFSQSRAGLAIFFAIIPIIMVLSRLHNPLILLAIGLCLPAFFLLGEPLIQWLQETYTNIKESRPGSTRVRGTLARLAIQRWLSEAPIWGHGVVERGPKIVEHMPIGTHHSWYGLLFVKGIVGLLSLAIPMFLTCIYMLYLAQFRTLAKTSLGICVVMVSYSFFENLEILAYLYWPALLWLGASLNPAFKENKDKPNKLSI